MAERVAYKPPNTIKHPKKRAWLRIFAKRGLVHRTCAAADIVPSTFYEWKKADPEFAAEVEVAREHAIERIEDALLAAATSKKLNTAAAIFMLKSLRPEVYRERHDVTIRDAAVNAEIESLAKELSANRSGLPITNGETNGHP